MLGIGQFLNVFPIPADMKSSALLDLHGAPISVTISHDILNEQLHANVICDKNLVSLVYNHNATLATQWVYFCAAYQGTPARDNSSIATPSGC